MKYIELEKTMMHLGLFKPHSSTATLFKNHTTAFLISIQSLPKKLCPPNLTLRTLPVTSCLLLVMLQKQSTLFTHTFDSKKLAFDRMSSRQRSDCTKWFCTKYDQGGQSPKSGRGTKSWQTLHSPTSIPKIIKVFFSVEDEPRNTYATTLTSFESHSTFSVRTNLWQVYATALKYLPTLTVYEGET
jgi:hypothetical protein